MYGTVHTGGAFELVVMAASQGGLAVYRQLLAALPPEFPAPVVVLLHRPASQADPLPNLLARHTSLPVLPATADEQPRAGTVYVAPADRQLLVNPDGSFGSAQLQTRLALADPLLASAAAVYGDRMIAVVASGRLADGAVGVRAVKGGGGRVLVQDQATADCFGMPSAAIGTGCVDFVLPLGTLAPALITLVMARGAAAWLRVPVAPWAPLSPVPAA
jgi:two-component system, chemotaxis family, protein-glutamate methylesterase/glutaminase